MSFSSSAFHRQCLTGDKFDVRRRRLRCSPVPGADTWQPWRRQPASVDKWRLPSDRRRCRWRGNMPTKRAESTWTTGRATCSSADQRRWEKMSAGWTLRTRRQLLLLRRLLLTGVETQQRVVIGNKLGGRQPEQLCTVQCRHSMWLCRPKVVTARKEHESLYSTQHGFHTAL